MVPARVASKLGLLAAVAVVVLCGCASDAPAVEDRPSSDALVIRLADEGYVEFDGRRMSVDRMLYELRLAVRATDAAGAEPPWIDLRAPSDGDLPGGFDEPLRRIQSEAYATGIRHIEFSLEDE